MSTAGAAIYADLFLLPHYCQQLHGEAVPNAGLLLIPQGVGSLAARFTVGKLVARFGATAAFHGALCQRLRQLGENTSSSLGAASMSPWSSWNRIKARSDRSLATTPY